MNFQLDRKIRIFSYILFTSSFITGFLSGCSDNAQDSPDADPPKTDDVITVGSAITTPLMTKAYQKSGTVIDGQYYLTYTSTTSTQDVATVNFGNAASPSTGIVTTSGGDELRWQLVGGSGNTFMYLDNVRGSQSSLVNNTTVTFSESYNPFKAAPFDSIDGKNDLLWGSVEAVRGTKKINFPLYHNMSRIRIIVTADAKNEVYGGEVGLMNNATVTLTSIAQTPQTYNRLNGELFLGEEPVYTDLTMVDNTSTGNLDWIHYYNPDPTNPDVTTFITQDFVLPPQLLQDTEGRPRLVIKTEAGKVFSGILPHAMQVEYEGQEEPYPVALAFLKQHILVINTIITQDPPELLFMPVKVIDWVDKGEWLLEGHQAGIYLTSEFEQLINYYQNGNIYQLARYGFEEDEMWTFNFWRSTILDYSTIRNSMSGAFPAGMNDFQFNFNGYGQYVKMTDGSVVSIEANELYQLVRRGTY